MSRNCVSLEGYVTPVVLLCFSELLGVSSPSGPRPNKRLGRRIIVLEMGEASVWSQIESLYRTDFRQFERVARAIAGDRESGLEAVQEGFADALRHADQWTGRGSLEGWVWRCVVNRARKARPRRLVELPTDEIRTNGHHEHTELGVRLAALPERQRLVVFLRYFADLEYREIAAALEIETGTVSATLHAAHANLRAGYDEALV